MKTSISILLHKRCVPDESPRRAMFPCIKYHELIKNVQVHYRKACSQNSEMMKISSDIHNSCLRDGMEAAKHSYWENVWQEPLQNLPTLMSLLLAAGPKAPPGISVTEIKVPTHGTSAERNICYDVWKWHCQVGQVACCSMLVYQIFTTVVRQAYTAINKNLTGLANIKPLSVCLTDQSGPG